ncbi:RNA polymerase sigma factor [Pedobacter caeni]|uniref:RNA polymerase sigma-70 factor, ECF subfamily n=1 Tax=Pedobacter caeni TaxID=288992 RepID=A0A1M4T2U0_9SPHI|nr:sigma-70 family RNA polymerase sigma factor [Pedobacter caeni]SHE38765.1 RNA polymerase sigma-70 factor, ECF subfamily [Pedobacter caeni]
MGNESNLFSDKLLVEKILSGNTQDFAMVVKNTERLVAQIVRKMVANQEDQKDLVQDIYLKAYQSLPSFKFQSKLSTWIATIAYNRNINYLEKKKIPLCDIDSVQESNFALQENVEKGIFKKETAQILNNEINKLPPLYKTLISLYHIEELPNREIAEITGLPEGTIKSYLYRARKILKENIENNYKMDSYGQ